MCSHDCSQVGKPAAIVVNFNGAKGRLSAKVVSPSGSEEEALVQEVDEGKAVINLKMRTINQIIPGYFC